MLLRPSTPSFLYPSVVDAPGVKWMTRLSPLKSCQDVDAQSLYVSNEVSTRASYLVPLVFAVEAVGISTFWRRTVNKMTSNQRIPTRQCLHVNLRFLNQEGMTVVRHRATDLAAPSVHGVGDVLFKFVRGSLVREAVLNDVDTILVYKLVIAKVVRAWADDLLDAMVTHDGRHEEGQ
jgi:hypothetical protein